MLMTTSLMFSYMLYYNKWNKFVVYGIMAIFLTVEIAYFIANVAKIKERWMFLIFEIILIFVMFIWYKARKVTNQYLGFVPIDKFIPALIDLSKDTKIPHFATHLVYLTKSNNESDIEKRIIDSILDAKPKRADIYWFLHVKRTNEPYTLEYDVQELVDDKIIRVNFKLGFRVQPRLNLYFKMVMQEMAERNELMRSSKYESLRKYDFNTDITYVIIERVMSVENELPTKEDFILDTYFLLKNVAQTDQAAFGLDHADTVVEQVPLVVSNINPPLRRTTK
jgi:KUP system potassium uptake protein